MNIFKFDFNLHTSSIDFYISGCNPPHCKNCHNPELFDFNNGIKYNEFLLNNYNDIIKRLYFVSNMMIFGGEPLDQNIIDLEDFLKIIYKYNKPIWLFTKYEYREVPLNIFKYIHYVKCGRYNESLPSVYLSEFNITLASNNQYIKKIN